LQSCILGFFVILQISGPGGYHPAATPVNTLWLARWIAVS
jgi:hypothetical protein